ncbi:MAG: acyl-ACP--UDP-N- acetylglucosamine O-acyltransferase [Mycobacteriaceae bacterium]
MANHVHPTAAIGAGVELGDGITIGPYAVLTGPLTIADDCWLGAGIVVGSPPEIIGSEHPTCCAALSPHLGIAIGRGTVIREQTTVHQGSERVTTIGAECYIMNKGYVAHDGEVGDNVTLAAGVAMGGHVSIGAGANIGLGAILHQRRVIGSCAMVGMGSVVTRDLPPFALAMGSPSRICGANEIGMQRRGFAAADVAALAHAYANGMVPTTDQVPVATASEFTWWYERATRPAAAR